MQAYEAPTKCHTELAAKQGKLESLSFMPLPGDSASVQLSLTDLKPK